MVLRYHGLEMVADSVHTRAIAKPRMPNGIPPSLGKVQDVVFHGDQAGEKGNHHHRVGNWILDLNLPSV